MLKDKSKVNLIRKILAIIKAHLRCWHGIYFVTHEVPVIAN